MPRARYLFASASFVLLALAPIGAPVHAGCSISATGVNFGAYDPRSTVALNGVGTIDVRCTKDRGRAFGRHGDDDDDDDGDDDDDDGDDDDHGGGNKKVEISAGSSGSYATRRMKSGNAGLDYNLYTSPTRTTVWGDGRNGTGSVKVHRRDGTVSLTVYGRIPAGQNVRAGTYADTLIVSIDF